MRVRRDMGWVGWITCLVISGCTVGPDYQPPETHLPEHWSAAGPGITTTRPADVGDWWTVFGDPVLNELIERAARSNLELKIAAARVREARALRGGIAADGWPQVGVTGAYAYKGRSRNRRPGKPDDSVGRQFRDALIDETADNILDTSWDPAGFATDVMGNTLGSVLTQRNNERQRPRDQNLFEAGFDAGWELDIFGGVRRSVEAADAETDAAREDYHNVRVTLVFEVARNYVEARDCQRRIAIIRQNIEIQQKTLDLTRILSENGAASELDVAQARTQLSATYSQLPVLETSFRQAIHRISLLVGELPDATLAELAQEAPAPVTPLEIPLGLPSDLVRHRPDIRRSERLLAAATARIGVATADLFPRFSLTGAFGSESHDLRRFLDARSLFWAVGPSVSWPILDGGRIRANIEAQGADQQRALAEYELAVLNALKEVEDALIAYRNERTRYQHLTNAVEANRQAVSLANIQYQEGMSDFMVVVDTERTLCKYEDQLVRSGTQTTLCALAVFKALGGGWETKTDRDGM